MSTPRHPNSRTNTRTRPAPRATLLWPALALLVILSGALPRCVSNPQPDIPQDAVVTYETVRLEYPEEDPDSELVGAPLGDKEAMLRMLESPVIGEVSGLRELTVTTMQRTNALMYGGLSTMRRLTEPEPVTVREGLFVWLADHDALTTRFALAREQEQAPSEARFAYRLEVRPAESTDDDAFQTHLEGFFDRRDVQIEGAPQRRGQGVLRYDFDVLRALDPGAPAGQLLMAFRNRGGVRQVTAHVQGLQPRPDGETLDSLYRYVQTPLEGGEFIFFAPIDISQNDGIAERVDLHVVWAPSGAGRAAARVSGGSLGVNGEFIVQECWGVDGVVVWSDSTPDEPEFEGGDPSQCHPALQGLDLSAPVFALPSPGIDPAVPTVHPDEASEE